MNSRKRPYKKCPRRQGRNFLATLAWFVVFAFLGSLSAQAQSEEPAARSQEPVAPVNSSSAPDQPAGEHGDTQANQLDTSASGMIGGAVLDQSGAIVAGAQVTLVRDNQMVTQQTVGEDGQFSFSNVAPGPFELTITATAFAPWTLSDVLRSGENYVAAQIALRVAPAVTSVRVEPPRVEVAETQMKAQETQRLFAVMPNFYVSYVPNAAPLTSKQKFELAWRTLIDPFTFTLNGAVAGIEQEENQFSGYGQGAAGYAKRYAASYADLVSSTLIGSALLPSLLKQDPRYFYKGTGTTRSRLLYALANSVICKGDNRRWEPNYSYIAGSLAAGGISNVYYPKGDRNRVGFVFESTGLGVGETAIYNIFQEFFLRRVTPKHNQSNPPKV